MCSKMFPKRNCSRMSSAPISHGLHEIMAHKSGNGNASGKCNSMATDCRLSTFLVAKGRPRVESPCGKWEKWPVVWGKGGGNRVVRG